MPLLLYFCLLLAQQTPTIPAGSRASQAPPAPAVAPGQDPVAARKGTPAPNLSREQKELFLKTAQIVSKEQLAAGTTKSYRATLSDGKIKHDAHLQFIDVYTPVWKGKEGTVEKNFRDTYKFNVAAYYVDKLLDLQMVPVTVEREIDGKFGSVTWWIDDAWMTEADRRDKKIRPPAAQFWIDALNRVKVFDQLIYNMDRNQGNLVIGHDWKLWMIDHTRAFRTHNTLLKADALSRVDDKMLKKMRELNLPMLTQALGPYLRHEEITALLARRDVIVQFFDAQIKAKGADSVLSDIPRKTPEVSVP